MDIADRAIAKQQHIAVPSMRPDAFLGRHGNQTSLILDAFEIQNSGAFAKAGIGLLQRNHVRTYLADHLEGAFGIAATVKRQRICEHYMLRP